MAGGSSERKRKSFGDYFGAKKSKLDNNEKLHLTDLKLLLKKSNSDQRKDRLVLMLEDPSQLNGLQFDTKPLNFGLYDKNGITVETVTFESTNKMRVLSDIKRRNEGESVVVISNWEWHGSNYKTMHQLSNKIRLNDLSDVGFAPKDQLESSEITVFKLDYSVERLLTSKSCKILETCTFSVAKEPIYFYSSFNGVLICDGKFYAILAVSLNDDGKQVASYEFKVDKSFKMNNVNAKLMEVANYRLSKNVLDYFMINDVKTPPVFYIDEKCEIVDEGEKEMEWGNREIGDVMFPEHGSDPSLIPLSEYFKKMKVK